MIFKNLFIEITRRCKSNCSYCLRGEQQNLDMSKEIMDKIFAYASEVDELMITGGEPLMAVDALSNLHEVISKKKVKIGHFRIVTSLNGFDAEKSFAILDKFHAISSEPMLDHVEAPSDSDSKKMNDKRRELISDIAEKHPYAFIRNDVHGFPTSTFQSCFIDSGKYAGKQESFNPKYLNGFDIEGETVWSDVYVSSNGNVVTSCDLSYDLIDNDLINFGNVTKQSIESIILSNHKSKSELRELEVPSAGEISFSQYWESLSEEKRGDYFGHVFHEMFDRNLRGFGIFDTLKRHPKLSRLKLFENFIAVLNYEDETEPPWFTDKDRKFKQNVKLEFCGFLSMICADLFSKNPLFELIDLYYHDCPYCAGTRLNNMLSNIENALVPDKE